MFALTLTLEMKRIIFSFQLQHLSFPIDRFEFQLSLAINCWISQWDPRSHSENYVYIICSKYAPSHPPVMLLSPLQTVNLRSWTVRQGPPGITRSHWLHIQKWKLFINKSVNRIHWMRRDFSTPPPDKL